MLFWIPLILLIWGLFWLLRNHRKKEMYKVVPTAQRIRSQVNQSGELLHFVPYIYIYILISRTKPSKLFWIINAKPWFPPNHAWSPHFYCIYLLFIFFLTCCEIYYLFFVFGKVETDTNEFSCGWVAWVPYVDALLSWFLSYPIWIYWHM